MTLSTSVRGREKTSLAHAGCPPVTLLRYPGLCVEHGQMFLNSEGEIPL